MRDPNRLNNFYQELKNIHKKNFPDLRFGQFIHNFNIWFLNIYGKDYFYLEDDEILSYIKKFTKEMKGDLLC